MSQLPIERYKHKILNTSSRVTVIVGSTGCGKSTKVPQFLLSKPNSRVVCVQPRRIAAVLLAKRVSLELGCSLGATVGYAVRFEQRRSSLTRLSYLTTGVALREKTAAYTDVVVDEVHENTLELKLLATLLKNTSANLVFMSATRSAFIDALFPSAELIVVDSKIFPVSVYYNGSQNSVEECCGDSVDADTALPLTKITDKLSSMSLNRQTPLTKVAHKLSSVYVVGKLEATSIAQKIAEVHNGKTTLVFLPGEKEINNVYDALASSTLSLKVYKLHGSLSIDEQLRAVSSKEARIVLSTNVAESSLTVEGITTVVDAGLEKRKDYDWKSGIYSFVTIRISKTSALQRLGRAGRTQSGRCYRLYTAQEYATFSNERVRREEVIDSVLFSLESRVFTSDDEFKDALMRLKRLNALDSQNSITNTGLKLRQLPIGCVLGTILLNARTVEAAALCAMVESQERLGALKNTMENLILILKEYRSSANRESYCKSKGILIRGMEHANGVYEQLLAHVDTKREIRAEESAWKREVCSVLRLNVLRRKRKECFESLRTKEEVYVDRKIVLRPGAEWLVCYQLVRKRKINAECVQEVAIADLLPHYTEEELGSLQNKSFRAVIANLGMKRKQPEVTAKRRVKGLVRK